MFSFKPSVKWFLNNRHKTSIVVVICKNLYQQNLSYSKRPPRTIYMQLCTHLSRWTANQLHQTSFSYICGSKLLHHNGSILCIYTNRNRLVSFGPCMQAKVQLRMSGDTSILSQLSLAKLSASDAELTSSSHMRMRKPNHLNNSPPLSLEPRWPRWREGIFYIKTLFEVGHPNQKRRESRSKDKHISGETHAVCI